MPHHREGTYQREQINPLAEAQSRRIQDGRMEHDCTENEKGVLGMNENEIGEDFIHRKYGYCYFEIEHGKNTRI